MELVAGTIAFVVPCSMGYWQLLFQNVDQADVTTQDSYNYAAGLYVMVNFFVATYILEMAFDDNMRTGLLLHHWTTLLLVLWGIMVVYYTNFGIEFLRVAFALSLYMSTEQNVFVELLFYHLHFESVFWYYASAWYYVISRMFICALSLWTWWLAYDVVFTEDHNNFVIVYAFWIFIPPANVILNITQLTTVVNLFGIAGKVKKRVAEKLKNKDSMINKCADIFREIDFEGNGVVTLSDWMRFVDTLPVTLIYRREIAEKIYASMENEPHASIRMRQFREYWLTYWSPTMTFVDVYQAVVIEAMKEDPRASEAAIDYLDNLRESFINLGNAPVPPESAAVSKSGSENDSLGTRGSVGAKSSITMSVRRVLSGPMGAKEDLEDVHHV
jgi:hypothetical protein